MARGQPPMRASTCNEALCCALRSALCLGQPLARGVDVQLMRRSALQRLASESLRGVQSCPRLAYGMLPHGPMGLGRVVHGRHDRDPAAWLWPTKELANPSADAPQTAQVSLELA